MAENSNTKGGTSRRDRIGSLGTERGEGLLEAEVKLDNGKGNEAR